MPALALASLLKGTRAVAIGRHRRHDIRLELQVERLGRRFQPHQRAGHRHLRPPGGVRGGHLAQHGRLVLPLHLPPDVDAPCLRAPAPVAERLERNRHLDGVSGIGSGGSDVPHRAPVGVVDAVGDAGISQGADRGGLEVVRIPPIEERVQHNAEVVVLGDAAAVAAQFVGGDPVGLAVEAPGRDVQVLVVEEHPHLGGLGRRRPFFRNLLEESVDRQGDPVHLLVEAAVEPERLRDAHGANRRAAALVVRDRRGSDEGGSTPRPVWAAAGPARAAARTVAETSGRRTGRGHSTAATWTVDSSWYYLEGNRTVLGRELDRHHDRPGDRQNHSLPIRSSLVARGSKEVRLRGYAATAGQPSRVVTRLPSRSSAQPSGLKLD